MSIADHPRLDELTTRGDPVLGLALRADSVEMAILAYGMYATGERLAFWEQQAQPRLERLTQMLLDGSLKGALDDVDDDLPERYDPAGCHALVCALLVALVHRGVINVDTLRMLVAAATIEPGAWWGVLDLDRLVANA